MFDHPFNSPFFSLLLLPSRSPPSSTPFVSPLRLPPSSHQALLDFFSRTDPSQFSHELLFKCFFTNRSSTVFSRPVLRLFSHEPLFDCFLTNGSFGFAHEPLFDFFLTNRSLIASSLRCPRAPRPSRKHAISCNRPIFPGSLQKVGLPRRRRPRKILGFFYKPTN